MWRPTGPPGDLDATRASQPEDQHTHMIIGSGTVDPGLARADGSSITNQPPTRSASCQRSSPPFIRFQSAMGSRRLPRSPRRRPPISAAAYRQVIHPRGRTVVMLADFDSRASRLDAGSRPNLLAPQIAHAVILTSAADRVAPRISGSPRTRAMAQSKGRIWLRPRADGRQTLHPRTRGASVRRSTSGHRSVSCSATVTDGAACSVNSVRK